MKRLFLVVFSIVLLASMVNSEELNLPEGFTLVKSSSPYKMVLTPYTTYPVMLEEYVPKVLFEAKWGYGPGEFGGMSPNDTESIGIDAHPTSIAVNSKGEIYILDQFNNRIQKFNNSGKYMTSIPVLSIADKQGKDIVFTTTYPDGGVGFNIDGEPYYIGKNIVIDTIDNLYYYCQKGISGEVWRFKNDLLINKIIVPESDYIFGIQVDGIDDVWLDKYNVKYKYYKKMNDELAISDKCALKIIRSSDGQTISVRIANNKEKLKKEYVYKISSIYKDLWVSSTTKISKNYFYLHHGMYNSDKRLSYLSEFLKDGTFNSLLILDNSIDIPRAAIDSNGTLYKVPSTDDLLKVIKWTRGQVK